MVPNVNNIGVFPFYGPIEDWAGSKPDWNSNKPWAYGLVYPFVVPHGFLPTAQILLPDGISAIDSLMLYKADDPSFSYEIPDSGEYFSVENYYVGSKYAVVIYCEEILPTVLDQGRYYMVLASGDYSWYSDIFTMVGPYPGNDSLQNYIKIEWCDEHDFITDDGAVVYQLSHRNDRIEQFWNRLYLLSDIGKPDYRFEEEGEEREGYFFPLSQISKKVYRFKFLAPEYLCDSVRLIRMADHISIEYSGHVYNVTGFSPSFSWQEGGLLAAVEVEFETNTVAKKIGWGQSRKT